MIGKPKYTREELILSLQKKAEELGRAPTCRDIDEDRNMPSFYPYYTTFGGLNNALKQAGLKPNRMGVRRKYTDDELLEFLIKKAISLKRPPNSCDMDSDPAMPSYTTYKLRFGSFKHALNKAGLKPVNAKGYMQHSKNELLDMLKEMARRLGHAPGSREIDMDRDMPASKTFRYHFGSLKNAIKEAGISAGDVRAHRKYTKEELLDRLKRKAEQLGSVPTQDELNSDDNMPSFLTYVHRFGSFRQACKEAGLNYRKHGREAKYTDRELLDRLKKKTEELGRAPVHHDLGRKNGMPPRQVYTYRFGGLTVALKMIQREERMPEVK